MTENEFILKDRIGVIKTTIQEYGEENFYLSFSGGKDSTILHYLLDMALPNNKIPRVFINTGIEYNDIVSFVKELQEKDDRFVIIPPSKPIKQVLENYGYPFKSKQHSHYLSIYQHSALSQSVKRYLGIIESSTQFRCPKNLEYQFNDSFNIKISEQCCNKLKKYPAKKYEKQNNKSIALLGLRMNEGGQRASHKSCAVFDTKDRKKLIKFKPLNPVSDEWEEWFIKKYNIQLCSLYYPPFNFKRTGCKGCPFNLDLQEQLTKMENLLPAERRQCEIIWKPIYEEYRRIGYRLTKDEQLTLF